MSCDPEPRSDPKEPTRPVFPWPWLDYPAGPSTTSPDEPSPATRRVPTLSSEISVCREKGDNIVPVKDRVAPDNDHATVQLPKLWRPFEVSSCSPQTQSRAFRCFCGSAFARNEELTRHLRIHSGQRPFECNQCGRRFGRKDHRDKHLKTHLRNEYKRIHRCPVNQCPGRYTRTDALNRHMLAAHGFRRPRKRATHEARDQEVPALTVPKTTIIPPFPLPLLTARPMRPPTHPQAMSPPPGLTPLGPQASAGQTISQAQTEGHPLKPVGWPLQQDIQRMLLRNDIYTRNQFELWIASRHRAAYLHQVARGTLLNGLLDNDK